MSGTKKGLRVVERMLAVDRVGEETASGAFAKIERGDFAGPVEGIRFGPSLVRFVAPVQWWVFLNPDDAS